MLMTCPSVWRKRSSVSCESCKLIKNMDSVSLRCSPLSSQDCHKPRCLLCRVEPSHRHLFLLFRAPNSRVHLHSNSAVYNREYTTHKGDNTGLPPSSGIFIISHHILKPICNHSFNILFKYHTNTDIILALIPYDNHFSITVKSLFTICDVSDIYIGITATIITTITAKKKFVSTFTPTKQH